MSKPFRFYLRVRYSECDAQKVVFNARYGEYVDVASVEFLRQVGKAAVLPPGEHIDYQVVKQTVEWKAPARFDQVLELSLWVKQLGNTSFTVATEFRVAGQEAMLASAETVSVYVDEEIKKQPIPATVRAALERGAPGVEVDHAGYLSRVVAP